MSYHLLEGAKGGQIKAWINGVAVEDQEPGITAHCVARFGADDARGSRPPVRNRGYSSGGSGSSGT